MKHPGRFWHKSEFLLKGGTSYKCIFLFFNRKKALLRLNLPKYSILQFFKYVKVICALTQNEYQRLVPNSPWFIHIHPNSKLRITKNEIYTKTPCSGIYLFHSYAYIHWLQNNNNISFLFYT